MKHDQYSARSGFGINALLLACLLGLLPLAASASTLQSSGVNLGEAGPDHHEWAIFSLGGGVSDTDTFTNGATITGDVGVAGTGNVSLNGGASIHGTLDYHTGGHFSTANGATITGGTVSNSSEDAILNQGLSDAVTASAAAYALSASVGYPTTINANSSLTLTGSGTVVLKLTDFMLSSGATLTLDGSAGTTFIIDVSRNFSLTNGSQILLAGGVQWNNVLFNVVGSGSASFSGSKGFHGILLAPNRTVSLLNGDTVSGEIIANKVALTGGSKVSRPPVVSP